VSIPIPELEKIVVQLIAPGKGILATDETAGTLAKRFNALNIACTAESRRDYRELMYSTPGLGTFISGVILFEETLKQKSLTDVPLPHLLISQDILVGIKVDKGLLPLSCFAPEKVTQGLDGLAERLLEYKQLGACFAKWRAVIGIGIDIPTSAAIAANAHALARYAAICQELGLVPIIEPEVLMATLASLRRTVPAAVRGINFLSGGQSETTATVNLNAINTFNADAVCQPWNLSFSYGRALQTPVLAAWRGEAANKVIAQQALHHRARLNSAASTGKYTYDMENE